MKASNIHIGLWLLVLCFFVWWNLPVFKSKEPSSSATPRKPELHPTVPCKPLIYKPKQFESSFLEDQNQALPALEIKQIDRLYTYIFDSLRFESLSPLCWEGSYLLNERASTIACLYEWHEQRNRGHMDFRAVLLLGWGAKLHTETERNLFKEKYLYKNYRWFRCMEWILLQIKNQNADPNCIPLVLWLLDTASMDETIQLLENIHFLDRGHYSDYYTCHPSVLQGVDHIILLALKNKVDDYHWWAVYPYRDAEQGLQEVLAMEK